MGFFDKIFGNPNKQEIEKLEPVVALMNDLEKDYQQLTDQELKNKTKEFRDRLAKGEELDNLLPEAFAVVREASKRVLGQRHYDVQLMAGMVLHQGKIAEMKTGEGKTLAATLPLYINALTAKGAHLITVNDYLARRDAGWMAPVYYALGLSCAAIGHEQSHIYDPGVNIDSETDDRLKHFRLVSRREAYQADITYGTNNEFGFDYLRDNMAVDASQMAQRQLHYAIVDEVDSILIDEARTPLIISSPAEESASLYAKFASLMPQLKEKADYEVDEKERAATLTQAGIKKMESLLGVKSIYDTASVKLAHHLEEALKAYALFKRDRDYVVKDGEVVIVDEFTGRLMPGRRYSEGLHQAIEAKEGVEVKRESDTMATITFQNLFRMYAKLAGMTGTAATEAEEFFKIYKLEVMEIPTNRQLIRIDHQDIIYKTEQAKYQAIMEEIKRLNQIGQPVLIGTISIEKNERLSKLLKRNGIKFNLLNAKHHEKEAKVIAQAGKIGAVTVATNMAGRGVDIILGGEPPTELKTDNLKLKTGIQAWEKEHQKVLGLGGLHIIGTERHEARRIDNQLRGRAGRQGDPGSTQFFVSLEDDLMRIFGGEKIKGLMDRLGLPEDQPIKHGMISRSIEQAQKKVEGYNFDIRKHLVEYDDIMNKHREVIYKKRRRILALNPKEDHWLHEEIKSLLSEEEQKQLLEKENRFSPDNWRQIEKMIYLRTIDMLWVEHLNTMAELREGIGLRGYGQHDPLVEYKEEAYHLFQRLLRTIEARVIEMLIKIEVQVQPAANYESRPLELKGADESLAGGSIARPSAVSQESTSQTNSGVQVTVRNRSSDSATDSGQTVRRTVAKVGRNEPCPCGATKPDGRPVKYKHCHGK